MSWMEKYWKEPPQFGRIAISGKELAIFGSNSGYMGSLIQDYEPFDNEAEAIEKARQKIAAMGLPLHEEISRPRITSMKLSYERGKNKHLQKKRKATTDSNSATNTK